jgi:hypothetical protein
MVAARQALPRSAWIELCRPIFGSGVVAVALPATRPSLAGDLRLQLAACHVVQALGIAVGVWRPPERAGANPSQGDRRVGSYNPHTTRPPS